MPCTIFEEGEETKMFAHFIIEALLVCICNVTKLCFLCIKLHKVLRINAKMRSQFEQLFVVNQFLSLIVNACLHCSINFILTQLESITQFAQNKLRWLSCFNWIFDGITTQFAQNKLRWFSWIFDAILHWLNYNDKLVFIFIYVQKFLFGRMVDVIIDIFGYTCPFASSGGCLYHLGRQVV